MNDIVRTRKAALLLALLVPLAAVACAGRQAPTEAAPSPEPTSYERVERALADGGVDADARRLISRLDDDETVDVDALLVVLAGDTLARQEARAAALELLGRRRTMAALPAFRSALLHGDAPLRAAAASALGELLDMSDRPVRRLLARALRDPEPEVQTQALQALGDYDVELLRQYVAAGPPPALRGLAADLLRLAESRGAALAEADALPARLERETLGGIRITFEARRQWPEWGAAVGALTVRPPDGEPRELAGDGVEAVRNVVPAFASADGGAVVYEAEREIRVYDVRGDSVRRLGSGIAPRSVPLTNGFVFLRERRQDRERSEGATILQYDVVRGSFTGAELEVIGQLTARARTEVHGNYSPVRWMRVRQRGDGFWLEGEGVDAFRLPAGLGSTLSTP